MVGNGGHVVERRTVNMYGGSIPHTAVSKRQFRSPHISLCLSKDTLKSGWSLLSGVYARGSKRNKHATNMMAYENIHMLMTTCLHDVESRLIMHDVFMHNIPSRHMHQQYHYKWTNGDTLNTLTDNRNCLLTCWQDILCVDAPLSLVSKDLGATEVIL